MCECRNDVFRINEVEQIYWKFQWNRSRYDAFYDGQYDEIASLLNTISSINDRHTDQPVKIGSSPYLNIGDRQSRAGIAITIDII